MINEYDHYIALDWAQANMAIARMTKDLNKIKTIDVPSDVKELQLYLKSLRGSKIMTVEESDTSQWLYTELKPYVNELIVCDPYRNSLLKEGPKSDKIDAEKLVQLLRANLLKPVFHTGDDFIYMRKIVSGYLDIVKAGVRVKNQRAALFRATGKDKEEESLEHASEKFVLEGIDRGVESYEEEKKRYENEFKRIYRKYALVRNLESIPGIGIIGAVKISAIVVDPRRIKGRGHFLSYCGLIQHEKISGGKNYGKKDPRYCRTLKSVFKSAAIAAISEHANNSMKDYYEYLIQEKSYTDYNARHAVSRRIAIVALAILKNGRRFKPYRRLKCNTTSL